MRLINCLVLSALLPLGADVADAVEKITIGAVEDVILLPWGVHLPARIDTGAASSSLDARELTVDNNEVVFRLPEAYGGLELRLPVITWRHIKSSTGGKRRPVVEVDLCLGPRRLRTQVTLTDRSHLQYPLLVGRRLLQDNFVVDVSRSNTAVPDCPGVPSP